MFNQKPPGWRLKPKYVILYGWSVLSVGVFCGGFAVYRYVQSESLMPVVMFFPLFCLLGLMFVRLGRKRTAEESQY